MKKCFVIMPITTPESMLSIYQDGKDHFSNVLKKMFIPAIKEAGFEPISPVTTGSEIIHAEFISYLSSCELVFCDMSIKNPNVFYEFGIRCALNKPVVLVTDNKSGDPPFDTRFINYITYNCLPTWDLPNEIEKIANHITTSYKKSNNSNAMWKIFGINQVGTPPSENATTDDKLDLIIQWIFKKENQDNFEKSQIVDFSKNSEDLFSRIIGNKFYTLLSEKQKMIFLLLIENKSIEEILKSLQISINEFSELLVQIKSLARTSSPDILISNQIDTLINNTLLKLEN